MSRYAYPNPGEAEAVLKQALALLDLFKDTPDPAAELARLKEADLARAEWHKAAMLWEAVAMKFQAENATLRTLYAAAVEECKQGRLSTSKPGMYFGRQQDHDRARANAGKEAL